MQDLLPELLHPPWNAPLAGDPVFLYPLLRDDGSILHPTRTVGRAGNPVPYQPNDLKTVPLPCRRKAEEKTETAVEKEQE